MGLLASLLATAGCELAAEEEWDDELGRSAAGATVCASSLAPDVFNPYRETGTYATGSVRQYPWRGLTAYPVSGREDFRGYGTKLPALVECSNDKGRRSHLDVTSGCLEAVYTGAGNERGRVRTTTTGYFRALALGRTGVDPALPVKWTDQSIEYRFYHRGATGDSGKPGFKAFARYRTEDDLYVASWRFDGVVQIQRKLCGEYTTLARNLRFGAPAPYAWHKLRFDAVGDQLLLYVNDELVLTATSKTFSWGTTGIRIDSADGALIDDWRVAQPR